MRRENFLLEDILQELNGAVTFFKLDLNHGYHQLELDMGSRHLTTFSTPWALKRYTWLNFGTVIAQEVFHEEVKKTIAGVQGAKNITDDMIVYGKTPELHDQALRGTLEKLKLNGLTLNRAKCNVLTCSLLNTPNKILKNTAYTLRVTPFYTIVWYQVSYPYLGPTQIYIN